MNAAEKFLEVRDSEVSRLIETKDWSDHPLGEVDGWPPLLITTLSLVLHSPHPMLVYWGRNMYCFYNDSFARSLGKDGKHPSILGKPAKEAFNEAWDFVSLTTNEIWDGKSSTLFDDYLVPIYRNAKLEDVYWTFSYTPIHDDKGCISGILTIVTDETEKVRTRMALEDEKNKFEPTVMHAPMAIAMLKGKDAIFEMVNDAFLQVVGRKKDELIGLSYFTVFPEIWETISPIINQTLATGDDYVAEEFEMPLNRNGKLEAAYFKFIFHPYKSESSPDVAIIAVATEITDLVKKRNMLKDDEERLRLSTESSKTATWDLNLKNGEIIHSNYLTEIFGYPSGSKMEYHSIRMQILEEDRKEIVEKAFDKALQTGIYFYEARIKTISGELKWIETYGKIFKDENGEPSRMLGILKDITERKIGRQKIKKTNIQLSIALKATKLATFEYDFQTSQIEFSERLLEIYGYEPREKVTVEQLWKHVHPHYLSSFEIAWKTAQETGDFYIEYQLVAKDGQEKWAEIYGKLQYDAQGRPVSISGTLKDISKYKVPLLQLEESEKRYRILADILPQFVWSANKEGIINYWNKSVFDYTGLSTDELMGQKGWMEVVHPEDRKENIKRWLESIATGKPFLFEHRFRNKDGNYHWQLSRALPQRNHQGEIERWIGTSTDIDHIKVMEKQKDDFIKIANHELKTPVTNIKGYVQLLMKTHGKSTDTLLSGALTTINNQVGKLANLINDMLDLSRIESGNLPLNKEIFDMVPFVGEVIKEQQISNETHAIELEPFNGSSLPVFADKDRISQVILNLLTNAIKYSPGKNKVWVGIEKIEEIVVVHVKDEGIGVDKEEQNHLFSRFYRVMGKDERTFPGFGIGLFIVSEILAKHDGRIWVNSQKDKGSIFSFSLPLVKL